VYGVLHKFYGDDIGFEESPPTPPIAESRPRRVAADVANILIDELAGRPPPPLLPMVAPPPPPAAQRVAPPPPPPPRRSTRARAAPTLPSFSDDTAVLNAWSHAVTARHRANLPPMPPSFGTPPPRRSTRATRGA